MGRGGLVRVAGSDRHRLVVHDEQEGTDRLGGRIGNEGGNQRPCAIGAREPHEFKRLDRARLAVDPQRDIRRLDVVNRLPIARHRGEINRDGLRLARDAASGLLGACCGSGRSCGDERQCRE